MFSSAKKYYMDSTYAIPTHGEKDQLKGITVTNNDAKSPDASQKVPQKDENPVYFGD